MKNIKKFLYISTLLLSFLPFINALDGGLDKSFGKDGLVITDFGKVDLGNSVVIQKDNRIVVSGYTLAGPNPSNFALARYNIDGSLDRSFGQDGLVITDFGGDDIGRAMAIQSDGRIIVAGTTNAGPNPSNFALARYNIDGTLDKSFGKDGLVITDFGNTDTGHAITIQPDGRIVVTGATEKGLNQSDFALARYNVDGSLDKSFGKDGLVITHFGNMAYATSVAIQSDGQIVVAGSTEMGPNPTNFALARYNIDGTLDKSFGKDGLIITDFGDMDVGNSIVIQPDGQIIVAGFTYVGNNAPNFVLARYNVDGSLDKSFGQDGLVITDFGDFDAASSIAIQPDQRIVAAGYTFVGPNPLNFALARYNVDGTLDRSFGQNGLIITDFGASDTANSIAIQKDGQIVVAGWTEMGENPENFALARYINPITQILPLDYKDSLLKISTSLMQLNTRLIK